MKKIFTAALVFLFLSCGNSTKHIPDNDPSTENPDTDDIENIDNDTENQEIDNDRSEDYDDTGTCDDIEPDDDTEITDEDGQKPDEDENNKDNIEDEDTVPFIDPCLEEPCKDVGNSTGECLAKGRNGNYECVCNESYLWLNSKKECAKKELFKGVACTGQTKCYDNEKEIPCPREGEPFYGQDANYLERKACIPQNYTVKDYGSYRSVTDNNSGLEWIQEAINKKSSVICKYLAAGRYFDWRLSTGGDLNSIVDSGSFDPAINEAYFPGTPSGFFYTDSYISETPYRDIRYIPPSYTITRGMDFKTGLSDRYSTDNYSSSGGRETNIRCVRDTPEKTGSCNFVFSSDDYKIVNFPKQRILIVIMQLPEPGKNWEESLEYCENLTYAGVSDWHLPNRNEVLFSLLSEGKFVDSNYYFSPFWTSTSYSGDPTKAIGYLNSKYITTYNKTGYGKTVSCIASDPCPEGKMWTGEKCISTENITSDDNKCGCSTGYVLENSQCVKTCDDDLCKDKANSTGLCLNVQEKDGIENVSCQCEENYFLDENFECVNPCDAAPCQEKENSDGSCAPTGVSSFTCGCKKGYYPKSNQCIAVNSNDCFIDYTDNACVNDVAGIMWSSTFEHTIEWKDAKKHCEDLEEAGYTDWRLPKVEDLWTFAKSCDNLPKESCEASEKNGCLSAECISQCKCASLSLTFESGVSEYSYYHTDLWSSSLKSDDPEKVIILYRDNYVLDFRDIKKDVGLVKCVRNIE